MFILIDKPEGITSHDVIDKLRKITGEKKIGHAGTLDPNATGLLIVGIGRDSTKRLSLFLKRDKVYKAEIYLGEERDTDDAEGKILRLAPTDAEDVTGKLDDKADIGSLAALSKDKVSEVLKSFIGKQEQIPPAYSAIKIKGKKAYQLARKGIKPDLKSRKIVVHSIKLLSYKFPILKIETKVSSGTYIRALARDIGKKLGCGAYLKNLRRTEVGSYNIRDAHKLTSLTKLNWRKT